MGFVPSEQWRDNLFDIIWGLAQLAFVFILLAWLIAGLRYLWHMRSIDRAVQSMDSGIFVKHGMSFDHETGHAVPHKSPSTFANKYLR